MCNCCAGEDYNTASVLYRIAFHMKQNKMCLSQLSLCFQAGVSVGRITKFLKNEEVDPENVGGNPAGGKHIYLGDTYTKIWMTESFEDFFCQLGRCCSPTPC